LPKRTLPSRRAKYPLDEIVVWLRTSGPWKAAASPDPEDPLLSSDVDSVGLERLRLAKAALAELDLEERRKTLLPRDKVRLSLGRFSMILRRAFEQVGKRYGHDAVGRLNEALDECERVIDVEFGDDEPIAPAAEG
jgi:hypothetical protein